MLIEDRLLERYANEYTRQSTAQWGMTFREYLNKELEKHELKKQTISMEIRNAKKK